MLKHTQYVGFNPYGTHILSGEFYIQLTSDSDHSRVIWQRPWGACRSCGSQGTALWGIWDLDCQVLFTDEIQASGYFSARIAKGRSEVRRKMAPSRASKLTAPSGKGYGACLCFCLLWEETSEGFKLWGWVYFGRRARTPPAQAGRSAGRWWSRTDPEFLRSV